MRLELRRLHGELRTTSLYVTHDQEEALTLGHRVAVIERGRLQQVGPPLEVYRHPANRFVAAFLGRPSMSFSGGDAGGVRRPALAGDPLYSSRSA